MDFYRNFADSLQNTDTFCSEYLEIFEYLAIWKFEIKFTESGIGIAPILTCEPRSPTAWWSSGTRTTTSARTGWRWRPGSRRRPSGRACRSTPSTPTTSGRSWRAGPLANLAIFFANFANFWRARSRLYQNEILQENMRSTAFFKLYKICILLHRCNLKIFAKNRFEKSAISVKFKTAKNSAIFNENFEIRERCKGVHCVDLGESFPTNIYLQKSASIQPRTSRSKFGSQITLLITYRASCSDFWADSCYSSW